MLDDVLSLYLALYQVQVDREGKTETLTHFPGSHVHYLVNYN